MPVVEQPAAQAAVAVDGKGDAEPAARCCPRAERDAETGDAIYYPMCGGRVPARRYQCGIAVCGPGGCALCCASLCLRSVVGAAAASTLSWVGGCAMAPLGLGLVFASNAEVRRWREADGDDRVILQATHDYLDRPSRWTHAPGGPAPALIRACRAEAVWAAFVADLHARVARVHRYTRWRLPLVCAPALGFVGLILLPPSPPPPSARRSSPRTRTRERASTFATLPVCP